VSWGECKENERNYFWEGEQETFWREKERERETDLLMIPSGTDATARRNITVRCSWLSSTLPVFHKANIYLYRHNHMYIASSYAALLLTAFAIRLFVSGATALQWARVSSFLRFLDSIQRRTTGGKSPLDEWSARRRDLYLTKHKTNDRHPSPRWDSNPQSEQASGRRPTP